MSDIKNIISDLKKNEYYMNILNILLLNGLLDIFEEELKDGKIDYLPLMLNLMEFLQVNRGLFRDFTSESIEKIIILSIDEILNRKFSIDIDEKQLNMALQLLKNTQMYTTLYKSIKRIAWKIYNKIKNIKFNCNTEKN
tara:strand:+ start:4735 stop:5151 length:417 start_codon:yes stop_codon:yes gene_type:complete